jgi:DNA helicase-2/ATP-dependent DNA helicase PcrA
MALDLHTLNENQLAAVQWQEGPLLVLAGPGSGKTRVLTFRIARLIESSPGKHFKILGLTFTNKAAAEMRERIEILVPDASERTQLTTFHSFAADILRQHGHHLGLRPDFTLLSQDTDRHSLLDEAIADVDLSQSRLNVTGERLLPLVNRLIENDIAPDMAADALSRGSLDEPETLAAIYAKYRSLMIANNTLDFAGLIAEALNLLRSRSGVQRQIQRVYAYICVDEFQDTNLTQAKILQLLVNPTTKNLFVVADDDQIIYQWNGASPERLWALRREFDMQLLQLPQNYRCPPAVVELANKLIAHNFSRSSEKMALVAHKITVSGDMIRVRQFDVVEEETAWIASDIAARPAPARSRCVILARTRKLLDLAVEALTASGLPGFLAIRKTEFESASLRWLHAVLRLANAPSSREQLSRVCKSFYSLEGINIAASDVVAHASAGDGNYLRGWADVVLAREGLSSDARILVKDLISKLVDRLDFWAFLKDAFAWLDGLPDTKPDPDGVFNEYHEEKATWDDLVGDVCAQYGRPEVTLHLLLQELDLRSKSPPPPMNGIPCYTIHSAKGMEFDHVYVMGLVEDQLPSWAAIKKGDDSRDMQEERRNCFVAITRSQETLTLTYSRRVSGWAKNPSRFLREMQLI